MSKSKNIGWISSLWFNKFVISRSTTTPFGIQKVFLSCYSFLQERPVTKSRTYALLERVPTSGLRNSEVLRNTPKKQHKVPHTKSQCPKICNFCPRPHLSIGMHTMDPSTQPQQEVSSEPAETKPKASWHDALRALEKKRELDPPKKKEGHQRPPPFPLLCSSNPWFLGFQKEKKIHYVLDKETTPTQPNETKQGAEMPGDLGIRILAKHAICSNIFFDIHFFWAKFSLEKHNFWSLV